MSEPGHPKRRTLFAPTPMPSPHPALRRALLALMLAGAIPLVTATAAQAASCRTSGPHGGAYTATVCFDEPADDAVFTGDTTVSTTGAASGTGPGVRRTIFYLDGEHLLTDYEEPYTFQLPSPRYRNGAHRLEAEMLMRDGFTTARAWIDVTFANGPSAPTVNTKRFTPSTGTAPGPGRPFVVA